MGTACPVTGWYYTRPRRTLKGFLIQLKLRKAEKINEPVIIARSEHNLSRAQISENALKVLYRLKKSGYQAYLVGGSVRDLLLGREPKDFDVGTDANPEEVKRIFRNCRLIGRRFRLAHVHFGREIIEVATFRGLENDGGDRKLEKGRIVRDNIYGTVEEDAWRRDFTVNALYYDIRDFTVVDYTQGMQDLHAGVLRLIGEPERRYREDPVRMLRAVRFASKLGFTIHPECEKPLLALGHLLEDVPPARLFDELLKLFFNGYALQTFEHLRHYNLFRYLFPQTEQCLEAEEEGFPITFVAHALANTDARIAEGKPVTPAFLLAALLWEPVRRRATAMQTQGGAESQALQAAAEAVTAEQMHSIAIPRRFSLPMREIWALQPRFEQRTGKRALRFLGHPRFRAAYDFLLLRVRAGEVQQELADGWSELQTLDPTEQQKRVQSPHCPRHRRRGSARKRTQSHEPAVPGD